MYDNLRRFRAIRNALLKMFPEGISGHLVCRLRTLCWLINGIVGSKSCHLNKIASKMVDKAKDESRVDRLRRFLKNEGIDYDIYYLPFCKDLLSAFADRPMLIAIDGSVVGRGCMCLMMSLLYRNRALPLVWLVVKQKKGHMDQRLHLKLFAELKTLIPSNSQVTLLGDGEFDGTNWQAEINDYGWQYVMRTAKNAILIEDGEEFIFKEIGVASGENWFSIPEVHFTRKAYGPVHALVWWQRKHEAPIYLITNVELAVEACRYYKKRFHIETFFSDQKSRGFNLQKSRLSNPKRIQRFLIAACLAYLWMIYLGELALQNQWHYTFHRKDRCDLSLFQLGLRTIDFFINRGLDIYVAFKPIELINYSFE